MAAAAASRRTTLGPISGSLMNREMLDGVSKGGRMSIGAPMRAGRRSMMPTSGSSAAVDDVDYDDGAGDAAEHGGTAPRASLSKRQSLAGSGKTAAAAAATTHRRSSVMGFAGGASSSGGAAAASSAMSRKTDPRPITSKAFVDEQVNNLILFLANNEYNQRISPKLFNPPTGKEFRNVLTFMLRLLDPSFDVTTRVEDDIPLVFKGLRYPFGISKTGLTAVGSPHTWPALLGALSWLIELLQYDRDVRDAEADGAGQGGDEQFFFDYLHQSYTAFLSGDDDRFRALDEEIADVFRTKHDEIRAETDGVREESARLRAELATLRAHQSVLPDLRAKQTDFLSDREKFRTLIQQLEQHSAALDDKHAQRVAELHDKEAELAQARAVVEDLRKAVDTQELSPEDVASIDQQRQHARERLAAVEKQRDEMRRELHEEEASLDREVEATVQLEARLAEYHEAARSLHLLSPDDSFAEGITYELTLNRALVGTSGAGAGLGASSVGRSGRESLSGTLSRMTTAEILGTDLRGVIKPALRELQATLVHRTMEARSAAMDLQERVETTQENIVDWKQRTEDMRKRVRSLEDTFRREKAALDKHIAGVTEQLDECEEAITRARDDLTRAEADCRKYDPRAMRKLRATADTERAEMAAEISAATNRVMGDMTVVADHRTRMQQRLRQTVDAVEGRVDAAMESARRRIASLIAACEAGTK